MKLSIVVGVTGRPEVFERFVADTLWNVTSECELVVVANGVAPAEMGVIRDLCTHRPAQMRLRLLSFAEPMGSTRPMNCGALEAQGEYLAFPHSDLLIYQPGWDEQIIRFLDTHHEAGLIGLAGAKWLGADDIYRTPYKLNQLGRAHVFTSLEEWQPHGSLTTSPTRVAVLDGLFVACRKSDFLTWGGWDEQYIHHMYDNDLSLASHYSGKRNYVLPIRCEHLSGQSANFPPYSDWAQQFGGDSGIHRQSHELFYEKWRGKLPVRVP